MKLKYVTITGVDSYLAADELALISSSYPFVEWGFLVGNPNNGNRYMPLEQIWRTASLAHHSHQLKQPFQPRVYKVHMSLHVCGKYVKSLLDLVGEVPGLLDSELFHRVQLNGRFKIENYDHTRLYTLMQAYPHIDFILQDQPNNREFISQMMGMNVKLPHVLFDHSGGRGKFGFDTGLPPALHGVFYGYAGGINPDNIDRVVNAVCEERGVTWIDMESGVRNDRDWMDFDKVRSILAACKPHTFYN